MKKKSSLQKEKQVKSPTNLTAKEVKSVACLPTIKESNITMPEAVEVDLSQAYILRGEVLDLPSNVKPIVIEKEFASENELQELVMKNLEVIFGAMAIVVIPTKETGVEFSNGFIADAFVFHFVDMELPRFYLLKMLHSKTNFSPIFFQMTPLFSFLKDSNGTKLLIQKIFDQLIKDNALRHLFIDMMTEKPNGAEIEAYVFDMLNIAIKNKPSILLISDDNVKDLPTMMETYSETWGKMIKRIVIKKYLCNDETLYTFEPNFSEINFRGKAKENQTEKKKLTEADHLENASEVIKDIYIFIKNELSVIDKAIEFNIKNHYISIRKGKNLAFVQIKKSSISLVVVNPVKDTQKQIEEHSIKFLTEKTQKFWNGECCTIVIEDFDHIGEIISLLKKIVEAV